jgi:hypothetical protein
MDIIVAHYYNRSTDVVCHDIHIYPFLFVFICKFKVMLETPLNYRERMDIRVKRNQNIQKMAWVAVVNAVFAILSGIKAIFFKFLSFFKA